MLDKLKDIFLGPIARLIYFILLIVVMGLSIIGVLFLPSHGLIYVYFIPIIISVILSIPSFVKMIKWCVEEQTNK